MITVTKEIPHNIDFFTVNYQTTVEKEICCHAFVSRQGDGSINVIDDDICFIHDDGLLIEFLTDSCIDYHFVYVDYNLEENQDDF